MGGWTQVSPSYVPLPPTNEEGTTTAAATPLSRLRERPLTRSPAPTTPRRRREGEKLGLIDGREVGFAKGFEIGQEIGFYSGCHAVWSRCVGEDPGCFSERARRGIAAFGDMLRSFPIDDPLDEEILETLNQVRGKFKTVVALLGMHHEYNDAVGDQPTVTF